MPPKRAPKSKQPDASSLAGPSADTDTASGAAALDNRLYGLLISPSYTWRFFYDSKPAATTMAAHCEELARALGPKPDKLIKRWEV